MMTATCKPRSVFGLAKEFTEEAKVFVKQEVQLAKTELAEKAGQLGKNAISVAIGGCVAYSGLFVLLIGLGIFLGLAFQSMGLPPMLSCAIGISIVGLIIAGAGAAFLMKGIKSFSKESVTPERTIESLQHLKGEESAVANEQEKQAEREKEQKRKEADHRTSKELEEEVLATEHQMAETLDELGNRLTGRHLREVANEELHEHPYRWGLVAAGAGLATSFLVTRKFHNGH